MDNEVVVFILGQAFGICALICTVVSMQLKKKKSLMVLQTMSEAFIVAQYLIKNAITGALMASVSFVRDFIFTHHDKKRTPFWVLLLIYLAMTIFTIISWAGPISLVPYVGSLIFAWTLWYGKVKWIRFGNAVGNTPYLIYTFVTGNYALFIMTLLEVISAAIGFIRIDIIGTKPKKKSKKKK